MFLGAKSSQAPQGVGGLAGRWRQAWIWGFALAAALWVDAVTTASDTPVAAPVAPPSQATPMGAPSLPSTVFIPAAPLMASGPDGVMPAAFLQQPEPVKAPAPLPPPERLTVRGRSSAIAPTCRCRPTGATPVPTPKELAEYAQFVEGVVDPRNTLDLIEGRGGVILLKVTPTRTQIADPAIASFRILEPQGKQMTIIGVKPGITVLNLWFPDPMNKDKEKILSYLVRVLPDPEAKERLEAIYKALEVEINKAFPKSRVRLTLIGDKLMASGQAHDVYEAFQIMRILRANAPGQGGAAQRPPFVPLSSYGPTGQPLDPLRPDATPGLEDFATSGGPNVINNMRIPGEQQVMLRVVVAEVNRAAARSIGVNFSIINNQGTTVFTQQTGRLLAGANAAAGSAANLPINLDNGQIPIALNALRTLNYARSLAEPNLTAMNGQTATFFAGGQFPVPVLGGNGSLGGLGALQGVQFIPFGVQLYFTPVITDRDRIRLTMRASVSTRDNSASTNVGGSNVPGLNARTFSTTVELREGQTMAVAGLIQTNIGATAERVPFFGDIPVLGRLASFQRTSCRRARTRRSGNSGTRSPPRTD